MRIVVAAALIAAIAHAAAWFLTGESATPPDVRGTLDSLSFNVGSPGATGTRREVSPEEIARRLSTVAGVTKTVRTYSALGNLGQVPALAAPHGIDVTLGVWLGTDETANRREMEAAVALASRNANVKAVVVGNETLLRRELSPDALVAILREMRARIDVPVTTGETWDTWLAHPGLGHEVDFIAVHVLPYWEGVPAREAAGHAFDRFEAVRKAFPGKPAIIAEFGWPSRGYNNRSAQPDSITQAMVIREFAQEAARRGIGYNIIEAFDQPWKAVEGSVGPYWGIFDAGRHAKFTLAGVVEKQNSVWQVALALVVGLLATILGLASRRPNFGHAIGYALAANALGAGVALAAVYPLENYLTVGSFAAWACGMVLMVPLTVVTLVKLGEIAEITVGREPQRLWRAEAAAAGGAGFGAWPKVSIQIPACREPPAMLIETLESVAALDYPDFEVLVVVNNTPDEAAWRPVEARCRELGARFKFLCFPKIDGYKAGALNAAMVHVAPDAELLAILDADYTVSPAWLRDLVPAFRDPGIAMVQAPQDHRHGEGSLLDRAMNAEYAGFFDIGMVQRNEDNAIIAHGTMLLLRRSAFEAVGGWATDTLTEDTELGLRLFEAGYGALYTQRRYGWGLLPDTYRAFKAQRHRWAHGAVQIIRKHWRHVLPGSDMLDRGQKYQFASGWVVWLSDAVATLAAIANLVWVPFILLVGVMLPPVAFTLPVVAAFCANLIHCAVAYSARLHLGPGRIGGAALAATSLQWTVAHAVYQGLLGTRLAFLRTDKGGSGTRVSTFRPVRAETLLGSALATSAVGLLLTNDAGVLEIFLFAATLSVQALPFLAATAMQAIDSLDSPARAARRGTPKSAGPALPLPETAVDAGMKAA